MVNAYLTLTMRLQVLHFNLTSISLSLYSMKIERKSLLNYTFVKTTRFGFANFDYFSTKHMVQVRLMGTSLVIYT